MRLLVHDTLVRAQVPLNNVDLSRMSLLYTQGEMAAVTPVYDYDFGVSAVVPTTCSGRGMSTCLQSPCMGLSCTALEWCLLACTLPLAG